MKLVHLRRLLTLISCAGLGCLCFVIYLNSLTMTREGDLSSGRLERPEMNVVFRDQSKSEVVQGLIRRKVHRDQSAAYNAEEEGSDSADPSGTQTGVTDHRKVEENSSTVRHLLPGAHLTAAPNASDHSPPPSTANSPMYIHHATISPSKHASAISTTKVKLSAKSVQLSRNRKERGKHSIWPSPREPWDDRIVDQLSYLPQRTSQSIKEDNNHHSRLRTILVYSSLGATPPGREKFLRDKCPVDQCTLSTDVRWIAEADAIVFPYDPGVEVRSWPPRPAHQIWVLSLLESPLNLPSISGLSNQINWTATYRLDSTIVTPYAKYVPSGHQLQSKRLAPDLTLRLRGKTKQVAWFVSNCISNNRRMEYARELSNYIQVDIYGDCGKLKCSKEKPQHCQNLLRHNYKFYLAFENSNCQYYITEKFFNALQNDVVPVVMGARKEDYAAVAPPHSFIHVEDFPSAQDLAQYLHLLDKNQTLYEEYFHWRRDNGHFIDTKFWCRLCALLHAGGDMPVVWYPNIDNWWRGNETCTIDKWRRKPDYIRDWRRFG